MHMTRAWLAAAVVIVSVTHWPQTTDDLVNDGRNADNVTTQSMGYDRKSYSPLAQINRSNVKRLVPVWSASLMNDAGELSAPAIYDGVMYVVNGKWSFAIDVETGRQIWRTPVDVDPGAQRVALFGAINRGAATIYNGKLYRVTVDNHLIALDMKTGKEVWNQTFADFHEGYSATGAPIVANGVVISGMAGGEFTTRGFLDGWDPDTGKKLWRRYTIPAPGEPGCRDLAEGRRRMEGRRRRNVAVGFLRSATRPGLLGHRQCRAVDPRPRGALDSLYTSSVIAIRPKTGELVCHFQSTPNDVYDVDGVDEHVLADIQVGGQVRKVMIQANKNGFLYVLDRTNCQLIAAHPYTTVNWASRVDLATGRPVLTDLYKRFLAGEEIQIYPQRGTNAVPIAFDPTSGLVYIDAWDMPRIQKLAPPKDQVVGTNSTGVLGRAPAFKPGDVVGHFVAMDPLSGDKKWDVPLTDMPSSAGMLATGGGIVFTGKLTGEFVALDAATGQTLWQFKTGSSVNATAITYTHNGRQFVTVLSGLGGGLARRFAANSVPAGGSVWTFALMTD